MASHSSARPRPTIHWHDWTADTFRRAADERKPVLLSIGASWCHGCAVMDRTTYEDPDVARLITEHCIPVRVDADRRPDINDRYNLEGWPTTALLTPSGEILTGSTYIVPDAMIRMLDEGIRALGGHYDDIMARAAQVAASRRAPAMTHRFEPDDAAADWVFRQIEGEHDPDNGGFGRAGKFLHAPALRLALERVRVSHDEGAAAILRTTLDGMLAGRIFDDVEGGFFRYAASPDWTRPHTEKMLEDQVAMIAVLTDAAVLLDRPVYRERADETIAYLRRTLSDKERGGFYQSQAADDEYYATTGSIRDTMDPPRVDRTLFTDTNAQAAALWLALSHARDDTAFGRFAVTTMERILVATYQPGEGVAHYAHDGAVRGLLSDQVHAAAALIDLDAATGNSTYGMLAEELMRTALRASWDERASGFFDRTPSPDDLGLMRERQKPFVLNCLAARVLHRLARYRNQADLDQPARAALASQTGVYRQHGIGAAHYALALIEIMGAE